MNRRVFRGHPVVTNLGLLLGGGGLLFAIKFSTVSQSAGILDNYSRRFDSGAINGGTAIALLICAIGAIVMASSLVARTVIDDAEIRFYDLSNHVDFRSTWSEVSRYEPKQSEFGSRYWQISAKGATKKIPSTREPVELHAEILRRLPPGVLVQEARPDRPSEPADEVNNNPVYNSSDHFWLIGAAAIYLFLGIFAWLVLGHPTPGRDFDPFDSSVIAPFLFAGIGAVVGTGLIDACDRLFFGRVSVRLDGLQVHRKRSHTEFLWCDIRFVEEIVFQGEDSESRTLNLVTEKASLAYPSYWPHFDLVRAYALTKSPADTAFVGFAPLPPRKWA